MYTPRGFGLSDVGDIEIFPHGDDLHLFHLTLPNHDIVQHAASQDGLAWTALPTALRTGNPGDCDDDQIWTMSVSEHDGEFQMLYTALARAEDGMVQRNALATSDDLITWTKTSRRPVTEADSRWYEADRAASGAVSWRDPKPIRVGDTWYVAVCARTTAGDVLRRGAVGLYTTSDFRRFEIHPPLFAPNTYWDLECPQVFEIDGTYYLTAGIMEDLSQRYWRAPSIEGPWTVPPDGGRLVPDGHYAGRVATWRGQSLYMCWHLPPTKTADWTTVRNPHGKFVPAPLVLRQRADGSLACGSFDGWDGYVTGKAPWQASVTTEPGARDTSLVNEDRANLRLRGHLALDSIHGGIVFRAVRGTGESVVSLEPGSREVTIAKHKLTTDVRTARQWFSHVVLQRGTLPFPIRRGRAHRIQLIVNGPYLEVAIDGEVVLATLSAEWEGGQIGVWAIDGTATLTDGTLETLRRPIHR